MFQEYVDQVTQAVENSEKIELEYGKKREIIALEIKEKIELESESITKSAELKNYSPIRHHNEMTQLIHAFEKIKTDELKDMESIKKILDDSLVKIMNLPESNSEEPEVNFVSNPPSFGVKKVSKKIKYVERHQVKEIYKIISASSQNNNHICRVWFTLTGERSLHAQPGDPIRIEWVNMSSHLVRNNDNIDWITATVQRHREGPEGIKIPQFDTNGRVTNSNCFYPITQWGETSSQRTWWEQWLEKNNPI